MSESVERRATAALATMLQSGAYRSALVCTEDGLPVAVAGDDESPDDLAGFVSLFDIIVMRAQRDLGTAPIDEVTLLPDTGSRMVLRTLKCGSTRFFLVLHADRSASWRRSTNRAVVALIPVLQELVSENEEVH